MQVELGYSPLRTGLAWLATTVTVFVAALSSARLSPRAPGPWLLGAGLTAVVVGALWLAHAAAGAHYVSGLLPAFLLVGVGFGFCGPAVQNPRRGRCR